MPKVSIGLPVYNGGNYLSEAIRSLLAQTFEDFELIICDNASSDETESISREFANKDRRIRYYRNPTNLGAAPNFNKCVELASGDYFKWAAHDDICLPDYLRQCVEALDRNSSAVLCHSGIKVIDAIGKTMYEYALEDDKFSGSDPVLRFAHAIDDRHWCISVFGLIRRSDLLKTTMIQSYISSDRNLIAQLSLLGPILHVPEKLFLSREHHARSIRAIDFRKRGKWFNTSSPVSGDLFYCKMLTSNVSALFKSPIGTYDRIRGMYAVLVWAWKSNNIRNMIGELWRFAWNKIPLPLPRATWGKNVD